MIIPSQLRVWREPLGVWSKARTDNHEIMLTTGRLHMLSATHSRQYPIECMTSAE